MGDLKPLVLSVQLIQTVALKFCSSDMCLAPVSHWLLFLIKVRHRFRREKLVERPISYSKNVSAYIKHSKPLKKIKLKVNLDWKWNVNIKINRRMAVKTAYFCCSLHEDTSANSCLTCWRTWTNCCRPMSTFCLASGSSLQRTWQPMTKRVVCTSTMLAIRLRSGVPMETYAVTV